MQIPVLPINIYLSALNISFLPIPEIINENRISNFTSGLKLLSPLKFINIMYTYRIYLFFRNFPLNIFNLQAIDIVYSGTLSSAAITLAFDFSSTTIRKVGSTELDTSATNVITVVCIDDTDAAALVHYTINTFATDTTP